MISERRNRNLVKLKYSAPLCAGVIHCTLFFMCGHGQGGTNLRLLVTKALVTWLSHAALTILPALDRQSKGDKKATPVVLMLIPGMSQAVDWLVLTL